MNTELWNLLNNLREQPHHYDLLHIVKEAKEQGLSIDFNDLRTINAWEGKAGAFIPPKHITDFIIEYSKNNDLKSLLDCWSGVGTFLSPLVQVYKPEVAIGLNLSIMEYEVAKMLQPAHVISWQLGEPLDLLDKIKSKFDLVVGSPPWGMPVKTYSIKINNQETQLHDEYASYLLLKASLLLNDSGCGMFLLPQRFIADKSERKVITHLNRFGLWIDSIFHLPSVTFAPATQIAGLLVVISRVPKETTFIGEITADANQRKILLGNLRAHREGKTPHLGTFVELNSFRSFPVFVTQQEINSLARILGLNPVNLIDICSSINLPKRNLDPGFADLPNSVYLPTIGNSPVVASLVELRIKPQNYIQLVIDSNKAIAAYVAQFLNSALGQKIRYSLTSGSFIPKITKTNLSVAVVYLPDIAEQIEVISTQTIITDISAKLETLSRELWSRPRKHREIQKLVKAMQPRNSVEEWLESLPFPISSVLWAYHADADVEHKVDHLLLFFEALAEFLAVIMLSAYASDKNFYAQESGAWIDSDPKYSDWVLTSTFGGWRILGERLAKFTRRLQDDEGKREICRSLFGNPSTEFLSMITDKGLFAVLKEVNDYRDQWKGHSGALSNQEHKQHLHLLESKLSEIKKVMQDKWESLLLVSPMVTQYSEGIFEYQVRSLVGSRIPFKQVIVRTLKPMDKSKLYTLHFQQQHPVELLPFVRLMESPKTQENAFYFYNRMDGDKVRWVSYHFDKESEIIRPDIMINSAIKLLMPSGNRGLP